MKYLKRFCALSSFLLIALFSFPLVSGCTSDDPVYLKLVDKLTNSYSRLLSKKEKLHLYGAGGCLAYDVWVISLDFFSPQTPTLEESRVLLVNCVEGLIIRVNKDEAIRPYLRDYPFTNDNVSFGITFDNVEKLPDPTSKIYNVSLLEDGVGIVYRIYDKKKQDSVKVHQESYAKAKRIVQESGKYAPITE